MSVEITTPFIEQFTDDYDVEEPYEPDEVFHSFYFYFYIITNIIRFLIYMGALVSDIYLIVIMCKFKKFRNRINNLLLMYVVFNIMYIVVVNLTMLIFHLFGALWVYQFYCIITNFDHLALTLSFCTLTFLAFDWYVLNYHSDIYTKFPKTFKYGIGIVVLMLTLIEWLTTSVMCYENRTIVYELRFILEATSFVVCGIVLICLALFKRNRTPVSDTHKTEYAFCIPKIIFLIEFVAYFARFITFFLGERSFKEFTWHMLDSIANYLYLGQPIIVLFLMAKYNKSFKIAQIRCCRKNVQEYDDDDMDAVSIDESHENHVKFDKISEEIRF